MKSIITLLAITVLAAVAVVGCNQNGPGNSMGSDTNGVTGETNSVPNTNMPASTNQ